MPPHLIKCPRCGHEDIATLQQWRHLHSDGSYWKFFKYQPHKVRVWWYACPKCQHQFTLNEPVPALTNGR